MRKIILSLFLIIVLQGQSQFKPDYNANFYTQIDYWNKFIDSLDKNNPPSETPYQIGSGYTKFGRWVSEWSQYMPPSGNFNEAFQIRQEVILQQHREHIQKLYNQGSTPALSFSADPVNWEEIGPINLDEVLTKSGSQWIQAHGQGNILRSGAHTARVDRLFQHPTIPDVLFACTGSSVRGGGGLFRSTDFGQHWEVMGTDQLPNPNVIAFAIKPFGEQPNPTVEYMFIGLATGAVYRSIDGGQNWLECGYHGTTNYPPNAANPSNSLPYSFDFINFNYDNSEIMGKIMFVPSSSVSDDYARLIVAREEGIFYSDNYTASLAVISPTQLSNQIVWQKFDLEPLITTIPIVDASTVSRNTYCSEMNAYRLGGIYYMIANIQLREIDNNGDVLSMKHYIIQSSDYGNTWEILGGITPNSPNALNAPLDQGKPFKSSTKIDLLKINPNLIYFSCFNPNQGLNSYGLYVYNISTNTWQNISSNIMLPTTTFVTHVGIQPQGFGINPLNENEYWFFTNDYIHFKNGILNFHEHSNLGGSYSTKFHADVRGILVIDDNTLFLATDGGVYKTTDATANIIPSSNGLAAAHADKIALSQKPPFFVSSGFWHSGIQAYNPEENIWHWGNMSDGIGGKIPFLDNQIFSYFVGNGNENRVFENFDQFTLISFNLGTRRDIEGSENIPGLSYTLYAQSGEERVSKNVNNFQNGFNQHLPSIGPFAPTFNKLFIIPNEPEKLAVAHSDANGKEYLSIYENMLTTPTLHTQLDLDALLGSFNPSLNEPARFGGIVFDTDQTGRFWMILRNNALWTNIAEGRIVEYDPVSNNFIDLTFNTDDVRPIYQNIFPPYQNISSIQRDRQTGLLYIATNMGVYVLDRENEIWRKISLNVPYYNGDIGIIHCEGKLYCATTHRGIWRIDLIREDIPTLEWNITANTTWDYRMNIFHTLVIEPGITLTVKDDLVIYGDQKIVIKPGGRLIIDGGRITTECNALWQGIEVHGNSHLPQNTLNQGRVDVINGGTIEYARNAIRTIATDAQGNLLWNQTGGMVYTNNAVFKDCRVGVSFITYHSFAPTNPHHEIKYKSAIRNSQFITTQELPQGVNPYAGVVMLDVNGIPLTGNTFENQRTDLNTLPVTERGSGIVTVDAQYTATGTYNIFNGDLHPGTGNNFNHLFMGIQAYGGTGRSDLTVKDNTFTNNAYGIHLSGSNYGLIARNGFTVPGATFSPQSHNFGFGIYAESAYGFNLEENTFNNLSGNTLDNQAVHVVNSSTVTGGKVYRNTITGVNYGTQMRQTNTELSVDCNTYTKTKQSVFDVHLANGQLAPQGDCNPNLGLPTNNTFNGPCNNFSLAQVYRNPGTLNFQYNYQSGTLSPSCHNVIANGCPVGIENLCPIKIPNPFVVSKSDAVSTLKNSIVGLNEDLAQERAKIDGGDTPHLLHLIATASPGDIKDALMVASPYLSDQVLLAFLAGNPPTGHIKDVMLANSPLSEEVREALSGINLPSGIRNQINSAQQGISPRQELEATINVLNTRRINEIDALTREYLDTNWLDSAVIFLRTEGSFEALCALMPLQTRSDTTATRATIDSLSHEATCRELIDPHCRVAANLRGFCQFHQAAMRIVARPGGYFSLTPDERSLLDSLAQTDLAIAVNARSILHFVDGVRYAPEGDYAYYNLAMIPFENPEEEPLPPVTFDIMPNPTSGQVTFGVDPATLTNAGILITDLTGKVVRVVDITHSTPTADLTGLPQGTYLCALVNQNSTLSVKKVIYVR